MSNRAVLQLNASYEPLKITGARRALCLVTKGKAVVEVSTDIQMWPGIFLPSVIRLVEYRNVPYRLQKVSRKLILLRDGHRCMYCGKKFKASELTLDHIFPKSRGGKSTWDNLVAACLVHNQRKANMTPEEAGMKLIHRPLPQSVHTHRALLRMMGSEMKEWDKFLWKNSRGDIKYQAVA